ncbi:MAG: RDD family protein [Chloroflexi bacterium]|nr:MAG: RDD family protein [Chloroflexota bacterium]
MSMQPAGFWIRVAAYIIDSVILSVVSFVIGFVLGLGAGISGGGNASSTATSRRWACGFSTCASSTPARVGSSRWGRRRFATSGC